MKHTPGPWEVSQYCSLGAGAQLGIKGPERPRLWSYCIYQNETDVQASANARLIAAAPDLLEACEKLVKAYEECDFEDYGQDSALTKGKQAIKKAKGGE